MEITTETILKGKHVDEKGKVLADLSVVLTGDGSTPNVQTLGRTNLLGYDDNGMPIVANINEEALKADQAEFMKFAIKKQKELSEANGIDPSVVNYFGAENENN